MRCFFRFSVNSITSAILKKMPPPMKSKKRCHARELLDHPDKYHSRSDRINEFYDSVRRYFEVTCSYLLKKLPLNDPHLKHAAILVDPSKQLTASQDDLGFFLKRFLVLLPAGTTTEIIEEQFASYQMTNITDCKADTDRVDETWVAITGISNCHPELKSLYEVMLGVCTIPHSSAACEWIFSCVRKTSTDQKTSLNQDTVG